MIRLALSVVTGLLPSYSVACRLGLALALDALGSVNGQDYRQKLDGVMAALKVKTVTSTIHAIPDGPREF